MSTSPSVKAPGQRFLTTKGYQAVNAAVMGYAREATQDDLGMSSPSDVHDYVLDHKKQVLDAYRAVGLKGSEIPKTWENLVRKTKSEARRDKGGGSLTACINRAYVSPRDRRHRLMG